MAGAGNMEARKYRIRSRSRSQVCGKCAETWNDCQCGDDERTESVASILASCKGLEDLHSRHLCVFIYISYRRWASSLNDDLFSAACLPPYEGWYGAWIKPNGSAARRVQGFEDAVLDCNICFHDNTQQVGYITRNGELVLVNAASTPRHGVYLDPHVAALQMDIVPVTQLLTLSEITSGIRGHVHGSATGENNGRKVSHIVREDGADAFLMYKFPDEDPSQVQFESVNRERLRAFAPGLFEEYRSRNRRRFTKAVANSMQPYLESFCARAKMDDTASREAQTSTAGLGDTPKLMSDVMTNLKKLKDIIAANGQQ